MGKISPISWPELVRRLMLLGFEGPFHSGKHPFMIKGEVALMIPNPHKKEISIDLLSRILKQAKISRKEWQALRRANR